MPETPQERGWKLARAHGMKGRDMGLLRLLRTQGKRPAEYVVSLRDPVCEFFAIELFGWYHSRIWLDRAGAEDQQFNEPSFVVAFIKGFIEDAVTRMQNHEDMVLAIAVAKGIYSIDHGWKIGLTQVME
jgi:hypothetical protein